MEEKGGNINILAPRRLRKVIQVSKWAEILPLVESEEFSADGRLGAARIGAERIPTQTEVPNSVRGDKVFLF